MTTRRFNSSASIAVSLVALLLVAASVAAAWYVMAEGSTARSAGAAASVAPAGGGAGALRDPSAFMVAERAGTLLVGLAAAEGRPLVVRVFDEEERLLRDGTVRMSVRGRRPTDLTPGCGTGCYVAPVRPFGGSPLRFAISVERAGRQTATARFALPAALPPSGAALLERARQAMLALRTYRIDETLSTGATTISSTWAIQAPDRQAVETSDGGRTVIIGKRRWDVIDGRWQEGAHVPTRLPWYPWLGARRARILGAGMVDGAPVTLVAAYASKPEPWWFVLAVDSQGRVLREEMLAGAHFMVDRFSGFDEPVSIEPPVS